ncbi:class E sortase [Streptomyces oryzae]|uniref:Class E sortase n=1 Tax=Streptomyces oryzae TaxID=1434886 RepID=A0ABS3XD01_9ACTN|nr:class E sortase [Streptomyces oryzae]MBO8193260.1 class E sortase [Streptomyces oryzae]
MALRVVVRSLSELCITVGILIVLFVVHLLYWTGLRADSAADDEIARLQKQWSSGPVGGGPDDGEPGGTGAGPDGTPQHGRPQAEGGTGAPGRSTAGTGYRSGSSFAVMYIPRFGRGWSRPVLENTRATTLRKGLGHYSRTAGLGQRGNFAVAGHRRTYGDPFKDFPTLRPGDRVYVTDGDTWYTYTLTRRPYRTLPSDTGVLDSVPAPVNKAATPFDRPGRYLTLTTCDPEWGSSHRLIAWARLDATRPASEGKPDALQD